MSQGKFQESRNDWYKLFMKFEIKNQDEIDINKFPIISFDDSALVHFIRTQCDREFSLEQIKEEEEKQ